GSIACLVNSPFIPSPHRKFPYFFGKLIPVGKFLCCLLLSPGKAHSRRAVPFPREVPAFNFSIRCVSPVASKHESPPSVLVRLCAVLDWSNRFLSRRLPKRFLYAAVSGRGGLFLRLHRLYPVDRWRRLLRETKQRIPGRVPFKQKVAGVPELPLHHARYNEGRALG
ncbi:unnamed protein product, partial [Cyprideis torosa]